MAGTGPCRIARVITRLGVGGSERYICSLTANMDRREFRSWLVCGQTSANERQWSELANEAGIQPIQINQLRRRFGPWDAAAALRMVRLFRSLRPEIVETHTAKAGAIGRIAALLAFGRTQQRPRLIHTFHGHVFRRHFSNAAAKGFIAIERWLAHFTDMIITVSPRIRDELIKEYRIASPEKIRVVPLGFDFGWVGELADRQGWLRRRLGAGDSTVLFGAVGRLAKIKNTALLLRAFARMSREDPRLDARLVLIGDGDLRETLQLLAGELGIRDRILFCGWVLNRAEIFSDLDVTCLSSLSEGLPVCLIESLAAGVPVIATNVGGVADVVTPGPDGELVESNDEEAFAAALLRAAQQRRRVAPERSAVIREQHSTSRMVRYVEGFYKEVLAGRRPLEASPRGCYPGGLAGTSGDWEPAAVRQHRPVI